MIPESSNRGDSRQPIQVEPTNVNQQQQQQPTAPLVSGLLNMAPQNPLDTSGKIFNPISGMNLPNPNMADTASMALLMDMARAMNQGTLNPNLAGLANLQMNPITKPVAQSGTIEYDNYCLLVGIPSDISEDNVIDALKTQNFDMPDKWEWKDERDIQYLRLYFKNKASAMDLIVKNFRVGPNRDNQIYPVMVLPWIRDKPLQDLLAFHEVFVEASRPVNQILLYLYYQSHGEIVDIVSMNQNDTKFIIIFAKQPSAGAVLKTPSATLNDGNGEIILTHSSVREPYLVIRKPTSSNFKAELINYNKMLQSSMNPMVMTSNVQNPRVITTGGSIEGKKLEIIRKNSLFVPYHSSQSQ